MSVDDTLEALLAVGLAENINSFPELEWEGQALL